MSNGKRLEMRKPPLRSAESAASQLAELDRISDWASAPALADAANAGLKPTESTANASNEAGEGEDTSFEVGTPVRAMLTKREVKPVTHLLRFSPELNERIEVLLDHIPRASKQKIMIAAITEYVEKLEKKIGTANAKRKAG